jgi:hypothetical protein
VEGVEWGGRLGLCKGVGEGRLRWTAGGLHIVALTFEDERVGAWDEWAGGESVAGDEGCESKRIERKQAIGQKGKGGPSDQSRESVSAESECPLAAEREVPKGGQSEVRRGREVVTFQATRECALCV